MHDPSVFPSWTSPVRIRSPAPTFFHGGETQRLLCRDFENIYCSEQGTEECALDVRESVVHGCGGAGVVRAVVATVREREVTVIGRGPWR